MPPSCSITSKSSIACCQTAHVVKSETFLGKVQGTTCCK